MGSLSNSRKNSIIIDPRFEEEVFSQSLSDLMSPFHRHRRCLRNNVNSCRSKPSIDNYKYNIILDLSHVNPPEISIKFSDGKLTVRAKRETTDGDHYEYREFVHKCSVPDNVIWKQLKSYLNDSGMLRIEAPYKVGPKLFKLNERIVPIEFDSASSSVQSDTVTDSDNDLP